MGRSYQRIGKVIACGVLGLGVLACNLQFSQTANTQDAPPAGAPAATFLPSLTAEAFSATPSEIPTATITATSTIGPPPVVTVSAVGGRLNVRRGPGPEYDPVGAFRDGESTTAIARNEDGTWLLINTPNTSKSLGWIIVTTQYTSVNGTLLELPVTTVNPAAPAYIRNCTPHEMIVYPIGETLSDRGSAPDNELQFFPGEYTVTDLETETEVASLTVAEGRTIDIKTDGSGSSFKCP
jgi:uncharacterized protein YgiM (DUF1202 family)